MDSCTSNMGHCLWVGIVDEDKAPLVAEHLMSPEMFTGWGIRTLGSDMGAYNPVSYHNGSVWPHDTALVATGLMRYGFVDEASRIASGLFAAAAHFDGQLPELFCGFDRSDFPEPVPYPTACSPQAWAAAAPVQLARILLRFDPDFTRNVLHLAPILPDEHRRFPGPERPAGPVQDRHPGPGQDGKRGRAASCAEAQERAASAPGRRHARSYPSGRSMTKSCSTVLRAGMTWFPPSGSRTFRRTGWPWRSGC